MQRVTISGNVWTPALTLHLAPQPTQYLITAKIQGCIYRKAISRRGFHLSRAAISSMLVSKGASWLRTARMTPVALPASILPHVKSAIAAFNSAAPLSSHIHAFTTEALRYVLHHPCERVASTHTHDPTVARAHTWHPQEDCVRSQHTKLMACVYHKALPGLDHMCAATPCCSVHPASMALCALPDTSPQP